jgi:tape measure domain-containing protein
MAEYNINFSTNAEKAAQEISRVSKELTAVIQVGKSIKLNLDTSSLSRSINVSFRTLNKEIDKIQTRLSKLQIGSGAFRRTAAALGYREGQRERGEMIAQPLRLRGQAQSFEQGSNVRLQKELRALQIEASQIAPNTIEWVRFQQEIAKVNLQLQRADKLADDIQLRENLGAFAPNSLAALDAKLTILRNKAREIAPDDKQWKQVNKEIQHLERGIAKVSKKPLSAGQRAGAAGGAFLYGGGMGGGVGSAVGGIAGGLAGGVPGAFAGAAIGQVADNLGTALAGITSQAAAVQKMQRGLAMASVDAKDFAEAQAAVGEMSQKLLMPLEQTTKYFAQLRANTKEYNLSVADTKEILEGTALAIMATGGSAEDLDGAMRAVVQIMSKGGVQAEELRGQLGERFPGAVVKFAQANKLSFEELQARLEAGTVGIREFVTFAKENYTDYAKFSEQLATAPEYAGQRLKIALEQISLEIGGLFGPMGADIQDLLTGTINNIAQFIKDNRAYLRQMISDFSSIVGPIAKVFAELMKVIANFSVQVGKIFQGLFAGIRQALGMASIGEAKARLDKAKAATAGKTRPTRNARGGGTTTSAEFMELEAAQRAFSDMGGQAAFDKANAPPQPSNLTFGGAGAGMSIDREDKENKKKTDNLESFERLRDQLANAYNQAEIERIKAEYELRKRLQEDMYDMQEFGANRLQRQNLQFLRALAKAEQDRQDTLMDAELKVAEAAGKIAPSAPILPSAGGGSSSNLTSFTSQQLARATQDASRFTGVANMCSESVKAFYKSLGISLPGVTAWADTVRKAGQTMTDWSKLQAGDIVATGRPGDTPHVGVYTGGQNVFHQSRKRGLKAGNYPDLSYFQQQGYFVRPNVGAGAPRKVGSNESRDTMAGANIEIAQQNAAFAERNALIIKGSDEAKAFAQYIQESFNIPDLQLSNELLKRRNELVASGLSDDEITYRLRLFEIDYQYQDLLKRFPGLINVVLDVNGKRVTGLDLLKQKTKEATEAERDKNKATLEGIEAEKKRDRDKYIESLQEEIKLLLIVSDEERRLAELRTQYGGSTAEIQQIFNLEEIKKNIEATRALVDDFVSSTTGDYKGFLKAILSGENAADALKQLQASLKDKVLTIFLDFAMAPIEKSLKEGLFSFFKPKVDPKLLEQQKSVTALADNTAATRANTNALKGLQGGAAGAAQALPVIPFGESADAATQSMSTISEAFSSGLSTVNTSAQGWNQALNFGLPSVISTSAQQIGQQGGVLGNSLGSVTGVIGAAASSIMGIVAGVSQMGSGGTSGVLGGIGSIFMGLGGALGGIGGMFGGGLSSAFSGGASSAIGTGASGWSTAFATPLRFANGGMVNWPHAWSCW